MKAGDLLKIYWEAPMYVSGDRGTVDICGEVKPGDVVMFLGEWGTPADFGYLRVLGPGGVGWIGNGILSEVK